MGVNERELNQIARQLGLSGTGAASKTQIDYLSSKSDAELEREILKIKEKLRANNVSYEKQVEILKSIAPMLDPKQRQRLSRVMEILRR